MKRLFFSLFVVCSAMGQLPFTINLGSGVGSGTGDSNYIAWGKTKTNITFVYTNLTNLAGYSQVISNTAIGGSNLAATALSYGQGVSNSLQGYAQSISNQISAGGGIVSNIAAFYQSLSQLGAVNWKKIAVTDPVGMLIVGDSMSYGYGGEPFSISYMMFTNLARVYGYAGTEALGWDTGWNNTVFSRPEATANWLQNLTAVALYGDAGSVAFNQGVAKVNAPGFALTPMVKFGFGYMEETNAGTLFVSASASGGFSFSTNWSVNAKAVNTNFNYVTFDLPVPMTNLLVNITNSSGTTNVVLGVRYWTTNHGVIDQNYSRGAASIQEMISKGTNLIAQWARSLHTNILIYNARDDGSENTNYAMFYTNFVPLIRHLSQNSAAVYILSSIQGGKDSTNVVNQTELLFNKAKADACASNGWYYVDLDSWYPDYTNLLEIGFQAQGDDVHYTETANKLYARDVALAMGIPAGGLFEPEAWFRYYQKTNQNNSYLNPKSGLTFWKDRIRTSQVAMVLSGDLWATAGGVNPSPLWPLSTNVVTTFSQGGTYGDGFRNGYQSTNFSQPETLTNWWQSSMAPTMYASQGQFDVVEARQQSTIGFNNMAYDQGRQFNSIGIGWLAWNKGGDIYISNAWEGSLTTNWILDGFSATKTYRYTNFPITFTNMNLYAGNITGTNTLIGLRALNTNAGVAMLNLGAQGKSLTDKLACGTNVIKGLMDSIDRPYVMFYSAFDFTGNQPGTVEQVFSNLTTYLVHCKGVNCVGTFIVGMPPSTGSVSNQVFSNNEFQKRWCSTNTQAYYVDTFSRFPSTNTNTRLGVTGDGQFFTDFGIQSIAQVIGEECDLPYIRPTVLGSQGSLSVSNNVSAMSMTVGTNNAPYIPLTNSTIFITNDNKRSILEVYVAFDDTIGTKPSITVLQTNQIFTNGPFLLSPIPLGVATESVTNMFTFTLQTNAIFMITTNAAQSRVLHWTRW